MSYIDLLKNSAEKFSSIVCMGLDPVIEESFLELCALSGGKPKILGKKTKHLPFAGEYSIELVKSAVAKFLNIEIEAGNELSP